MVTQDRELEVVFLEYLHPLLQDDSSIEHPGLVALVVDVVFRMDGLSMCLPETKTPALVMNWEEGKMERFDGKE